MKIIKYYESLDKELVDTYRLYGKNIYSDENYVVTVYVDNKHRNNEIQIEFDDIDEVIGMINSLEKLKEAMIKKD